MGRTKIIIDADVLIHFSKADRLSMLPSILPEYEYAILSAVYEETISIRNQIDNQTRFMKNIVIIPFSPTGQMKLEYARLRSKYGKGESACMAYCKFTNNVIGSSNLKDIKEYCQQNQITYLTTLDFLYYAFERKMMTDKDCDEFINAVNQKGSRLPAVKIATYIPNNHL